MAGAAFLCMIALSCNVARAQIYNWTTIAGVANTIGSADGTNSGALFNAPYGVALDGSGNVYVADHVASTIRKMTHVGTNWVVTTIAGSAANSGSADGINTAALFNGPRGLVVGNNGNIFISDEGNHCIRMLTAIGTNWVSSTIAGSVTNPGSADGIGSAAQFEEVDGIIQGKGGNLFVASYDDDTIREVTPSGTNWIVITIAGLAQNAGSSDGIGTDARFNNPYDVAVDGSGNLYVADSRGQTTRMLTPSGTNWVVSTIAGSYEKRGAVDGTNSNARFNYASGVAVDSGGKIYVADTYSDTIRKLLSVGTNWIVSTIGGVVSNTVAADGTNGVATFYLPRGLKIDSRGNVYVADFDHSTIRLGTPLIPYMLSTRVSGTNLLINGISGLAGGKYFVLASTNVALPFSQWTPVATNILNTTGNFTMTATNAVNPNVRQEFYILQLQ